MSIKKKLHHLVSGQLPEFVKAEHPQFVSFLEHYYKFLETSNQVHDVFLGAQTWNDIDETLDAFIPYYRAQFSYDIPSDTITTNRRLIKYINQYYEGKGSENATEMFFRFMFNDTATVAYPGDYILRASDGKWSRKKYIKVETTEFSSEDIFELIGTIITLRYLEFIQGAGNFERTITTRCFDIFETARPNIYQLEVDINPSYVFPDYISVDSSLAPSLGNHDTHVYVQRNGTTYGTITKQLISVASIDTTGSKFRRDDSYFISETGVEGAYFAGQYTVNLTGPSAYVYETIQNNAVVRITKTKSTLAEQYFLEDYVIFGDYASAPTLGQVRKLSIIDTGERFLVRTDDNEPVTTFTVELFPSVSSGSAATITFNTGLIYQAPGEFKDNAGFLSDIIKLQDNDYYQPYSYVVRSTTPLNLWKNTYLESTHPAGFKLFAELQLTDNLTSSVTVVDEFAQVSVFDLGLRVVEDEVTLSEIVSKSVTTGASDSISLSDSLSATLTFIRNFTETVSSTDAVNTIDTSLDKTEVITTSEVVEYALDKEIVDATILTDSTVITTNLTVSDTVTLSDALSYEFSQQDDLTSDLVEDVTASETVALSVNKSALDTISTSEDVSFDIDKSLSDTQNITEVIEKNLSYVLADTQSNTDSPELSVDKPVSDSISTSDNIDILVVIPVTLTDTITVSDSITQSFNQENDATSDLQEDITLTDSTSFDIEFVATSETVSLSDTNSVINTNKSETDTVTISESIDEIWTDSYFEDGEYSVNAYVTGKYVGTEHTP